MVEEDAPVLSSESSLTDLLPHSDEDQLLTDATQARQNGEPPPIQMKTRNPQNSLFDEMSPKIPLLNGIGNGISNGHIMEATTNVLTRRRRSLTEEDDDDQIRSEREISEIGPSKRRRLVSTRIVREDSVEVLVEESHSQLRQKQEQIEEKRYLTRSKNKNFETKDGGDDQQEHDEEMPQTRRTSGRLAEKVIMRERERGESKVSSSKYDSEDYGQDEDEVSETEEHVISATYIPINTKYGFRKRPLKNYNENGGPMQPRTKIIQQNGEDCKHSEDSDHGERREYNLRKREKRSYAIPPPISLKDSSRNKHQVGPRHHRSRDSFRDHHRSDRGDRRIGMPLFGRGSRFGSGALRGDNSSDSDDIMTNIRKGFKHRMGYESNARLLPMNLKDLAGTRADLFPTALAVGDTDQLSGNGSVNFESVGGLNQHVKSLKEMVLLPLLYPEIYSRFKIVPPRGVLFYGPPGTGKTLLARALAASCSTQNQKVAFFMRKGADCLSKWVGEAERQLRLLFEEARAWQPSIIFFDEIDGLAPIRSSKSEQVHASIVSTLLALMDGLDNRGQVIVIGATNRIDAIDPALRRPGRFDREFHFPLPNEVGRRTIIDIQTPGWDPPLENSFKDRLAEITKGYSGADIKALCTEAALKAIQRRYPQIYESADKLLIDPTSIKIQERDFLRAAKSIIPSSQRSSGPTGVALPKILEPLLGQQLNEIIGHIRLLFPDRQKIALTGSDEEDEDDDTDSENPAVDNEARQRKLEGQMKSLAGMQEYRLFRPRLLISGPPGMGQRHIGPALLHDLEGYHIQSFDLATLMSDSTRTPEATCIQLFLEVKRHKPSVIYLPNLNTWCNVISDQVKATFSDLLNDLPAQDPILLLATCECSLQELPFPIKRWFFEGTLGNFEVQSANSLQRTNFFSDLIMEAQRPPTPMSNATKGKKTRREREVLSKAPLPPPKEPTLEQKKALREHDDYVFRELRIELRAMTEDLLKDRRFKYFLKQDEESNEVQTEIIRNPMDLYTILHKVNNRQYLTLEDYTADITLIRTNTELLHGVGTDLSSRAVGLLDEVESMVYRLNPDLVEELKISAARRRLEIDGYMSKSKQPPKAPVLLLPPISDTTMLDSMETLEPTDMPLPSAPSPAFIINNSKLDVIKEILTTSTNGMTVEQLDHLRADLYLSVWKYRHEWDRIELLKEMEAAINHNTQIREDLELEKHKEV